MHMCVRFSVYRHMDAGSYLLPLCFETESVTQPKGHWSSYPGWPVSPRVLLSLPTLAVALKSMPPWPFCLSTEKLKAPLLSKLSTRCVYLTIYFNHFLCICEYYIGVQMCLCTCLFLRDKTGDKQCKYRSLWEPFLFSH